jgi:hypothetical protein
MSNASATGDANAMREEVGAFVADLAARRQPSRQWAVELSGGLAISFWR